MTKQKANTDDIAPHESDDTPPPASDVFAYPVEANLDAQDDIIAALNAMTPADMNIDVMLDHLTVSNDLFNSPHLDLSALVDGLGGHE